VQRVDLHLGRDVLVAVLELREVRVYGVTAFATRWVLFLEQLFNEVLGIIRLYELLLKLGFVV